MIRSSWSDSHRLGDVRRRRLGDPEAQVARGGGVQHGVRVDSSFVFVGRRAPCRDRWDCDGKVGAVSVEGLWQF